MKELDSDSGNGVSVASQDLRVFVVMPTYNRWERARVSLDRLMKSDYRNFQILLVEDACTDRTVESCRTEFPDVQILHGDGNLWWSGATNLGTRHALEAGADAVLWINDDIEVEPQTLGSLVASHQNQGEKSVVCARIRLPGGEREWRGDPPPWHPDFKSWQPLEFPAQGDLPIIHPPGGQGVLIPAKCFREIGLVENVSLPQHWGDHDFHYRAMRAGYKYFISPRAVVWESANKQSPQVRNLFTIRNSWWFLTNRGSHGNLRSLRRHLKRNLPTKEYRQIFYPILAKHLAWLSYGWLTRKPLLHKPISVAKKTVVGKTRS